MVKIVKDYIPRGASNRPGRPNPMNYVTIHNTGNTRAGANAQAHANFVKSQAARDAWVSWHYTIDDEGGFQHLPDNEDAFHASSERGNRQSIGIEIAINSDGNLLKATDNAAMFTGALCRMYGIPLDNVRQHNSWCPSRQNCPAQIRAGQPYDWNAFIQKVREFRDSTTEYSEGEPGVNYVVRKLTNSQFFQQSNARRGDVVDVKDVETGQWFQAQVSSFSDSYHLDWFPANEASRQIVESLRVSGNRGRPGNGVDWNARPAIIRFNGVTSVASFNTAPHASNSPWGGGVTGHACLHFINSQSAAHNMQVDPRHQTAIREVYKIVGGTSAEQPGQSAPTEQPGQTEQPTAFEPYLVRVRTNALDIYAEPSKDSNIVGLITSTGTYTIVAESTDSSGRLWGRLRSGAGYILLGGAVRV